MGGLHTLLIIVIALLVLLFLVSAGLCTYAVFPKRFGLDETRKIELGKAYLKGTEFPAKEVYTVSSYDGYILHAEYIETDPQSKKFVIISHGYTYTRYGSYKYVYLFQKMGFNCIIYDDRGHGENKRCRCMFGIRESKDLLAMIEDTYQRFGREIFLGLHGESMGSGLSLMALQYKPDVKFLVADCGYGRLQEVLCGKVREVFHLPGTFAYLASFVCRILYGFSLAKINPEESLKENEIPVCFIHGEADSFIPCSQSERMHRINKGYSEIHTFPGAEHAQSVETDMERYEDILRAFVAKVLQESEGGK